MTISPTILASFRKYAATGKASKEALTDFHKYGLIEKDEYDSPVTTAKGGHLLKSH